MKPLSPTNQGRRRELSCQNNNNVEPNTNQNIVKYKHGDIVLLALPERSYAAMRPGLDAAGQ